MKNNDYWKANWTVKPKYPMYARKLIRGEPKMKQPESDKKNQQTCNKCGRVVGCDYRGRKHKCDCSRENGK